MLFMMSYNGLRRVLKLQCSGIMNFWCSHESENPSYFRFFRDIFKCFQVVQGVFLRIGICSGVMMVR